MEESREGFMFFRTYALILDGLPEPEALEMMRRICRYALDGVEPTDFENDVTKLVWSLIFCSLKKSRACSENAQKRWNKAQKKGEIPEKAPEEKPATPAEKPVAPAEKPVVPAEKPVVPAEKPVVPAEKPVAPAEKPSAAREDPEVVAVLEGLGVVVDCPVEGVDANVLKERFSESAFLREKFRCLSKIKRHYDKIVVGAYRDVAPKKTEGEYQKHGHSAEKLRSALVNFDEWEE